MTVGSEHVGSQVRLRGRATSRDLDGWLLAYSSHPRAVILLPDGTRLDRPAAAVSPLGDGRSTGGTVGGVTYDEALSYDLTRRAAAERALDPPDAGPAWETRGQADTRRATAPAAEHLVNISYDVTAHDSEALLRRAADYYAHLTGARDTALPPHAILTVECTEEARTAGGDTVSLLWSAHVTIEDQW